MLTFPTTFFKQAGGNFLSGYTKRQKFTIDATKVTADQTDFPFFLDLSDFSLGGADVFDVVQSAGEDIRITTSDGETELPVDIVAIDTTGKTGTIHFKVSGTLSSSTDTDFYLYYNGTSSAVARGAANGSDAVWSDYAFVMHLNEAVQNDVDGYNESTSNLNHGQGTSMTEAARALPLGLGASFITNVDRILVGADTAMDSLWGGGGTMSCIFNQDVGTFQARLLDKASGGWQALVNNDSKIFMPVWFSGANGQWASTAESFTIGADTHLVITYDGSSTSNDPIFYTGGSSHATTEVVTPTGTIDSDTGVALTIANFSNPIRSLDGILQEIRFRKEILSATWVATEYNSQSNNSTFKSVSAEETA